jgi:hypothetical protein
MPRYQKAENCESAPCEGKSFQSKWNDLSSREATEYILKPQQQQVNPYQ